FRETTKTTPRCRSRLRSALTMTRRRANSSTRLSTTPVRRSTATSTTESAFDLFQRGDGYEDASTDTHFWRQLTINRLSTPVATQVSILDVLYLQVLDSD